jgi:hypothetical protein
LGDLSRATQGGGRCGRGVFLPLLSFSNKLIVDNLDKLVGEFSSRGENAFVHRVEGSLLPLISSIRRSAWLWEVD